MSITVYILKLADNTYYTGMTNNTERRFKQHNAGDCNYTSTRLPFQCVFKYDMPNYKYGRWLEKKIKHAGAKNYLATLDIKFAKDILYNII